MVIGLLIIVWILIGVKNLGKLNTVVMSVLFICTVILSAVVFSGGADFSGEGGLSFGAAVELSVAMPLSWLPVISDYTKEAKKPFGATLASTVTYFAASCWMYVIGMAAALFTGESEIAKIMLTAGLGIIGIITLIASTVTTTFLDAYSAGVSAFSIWGKLNIKWTAVAIAAVGTVLAIFTPIEQFENFLYLIGSVFAPMIAVQIADTFILKKNYEKIGFNVQNLVIWLAGFIIYRIFMKFDTPVGYTLPAMLIVVVICVLADKIRKMAGK